MIWLHFRNLGTVLLFSVMFSRIAIILVAPLVTPYSIQTALSKYTGCQPATIPELDWNSSKGLHPKRACLEEAKASTVKQS